MFIARASYQYWKYVETSKLYRLLSFSCVLYYTILYCAVPCCIGLCCNACRSESCVRYTSDVQSSVFGHVKRLHTDIRTDNHNHQNNNKFITVATAAAEAEASVATTTMTCEHALSYAFPISWISCPSIERITYGYVVRSRTNTWFLERCNVLRWLCYFSFFLSFFLSLFSSLSFVRQYKPYLQSHQFILSEIWSKIVLCKHQLNIVRCALKLLSWLVYFIFSSRTVSVYGLCYDSTIFKPVRVMRKKRHFSTLPVFNLVYMTTAHFVIGYFSCLHILFTAMIFSQ